MDGFDVRSAYDEQDGYEGTYPPDWEHRRRAVLARDDYTCQRCGVKSGPHAGDSGATLHVHHVRPLSEGGSNRPSNLLTLCADCHEAEHGHAIERPPAAEPTRRPSARVRATAHSALSLGIAVAVGWLLALVVGGRVTAAPRFALADAGALLVALLAAPRDWVAASVLLVPVEAWYVWSGRSPGSATSAAVLGLGGAAALLGALVLRRRSR
ncbi:MAG: HNH endonuclease [Halanaeroarchaeum sp.]